MMHFIRSLCIVAMLACNAAAANPQALPQAAASRGQQIEADVVIYGGTSAGVIAAVQAAKMNRSVVLIEPTPHLGGMTSSGLGSVDVNRPDSVGGLTREFFHRVWKHYRSPDAWTWEKPTHRKGQHAPLPPGEQTKWVVEPSVAERIFDRMIAESGATVLRGERLNRQSGVEMEGLRITRIVMESGVSVAGRMFIDATYEGDLMAAAGVTYIVGREANSRYGETMNGIRPMPDRAKELRIDPYITKGDPSSGLLPRVHATLGGEEFEADRGVQAYNYRMCMTDVPGNRVMIAKPEGYREIDYEIILRYLENGGKKETIFTTRVLANRKTDSNNSGPSFSTDFLGMSWDWPEASYEERRKIAAAHEAWQRGLVWTVQNHPRVPEAVRRHYAPWGLARDEFVDNDHWPYQLYVRQGRRMVSDFVMTEKHVMSRVKPADDSVGLGCYACDSHGIKYYVDEASGFVTVDGSVYRPGFSYRPPRPYPISYRSIVPRVGECENLLVPVCLSASHVAHSSIRMEPVFMILGQSAATAASIAIERESSVHAVPYEDLRARLIEDGQRL